MLGTWEKIYRRLCYANNVLPASRHEGSSVVRQERMRLKGSSKTSSYDSGPSLVITRNLSVALGNKHLYLAIS